MLDKMDPTYASLLSEKTTIRQKLMKRIEQATGRRLISYISVVDHPQAMIQGHDVVPLTDVLSSVGEDQPLDVMINSPGGLPDVAHKLLQLMRAKRSDLGFVVPNYAKSAATLMALGSDRIIMGQTSELGPIDPQVPKPTPQGVMYLPAHTIVDSYDQLADDVNKRGVLRPADAVALAGIDLAFVDYCRKSMNDAEVLAKEYLKQHMLSHDPSLATYTAEFFAQNRGSHGSVVDFAVADKLGLAVQYEERSSKLWKLVWELYCRSECMLRETNNAKLYESSTVSLSIRI